MPCINCGGLELEKNQFNETVCNLCSHVQELQRFDNNIAFNETHGVVGQRIDIYADNAAAKGRSYGGYVSAFDKEVDVTLNFLKTQLEVEEEYSDSFNIARNLLRLAQQSMNERWQHLHIYVGAALYFGFRSKQAPYLLIDISDKLEKCNVIKLARCYLKLLNFLKQDCFGGESSKLSQSLQFIDPSIYIPRFVRALEFKEKQGAIIETAKKLVKRMMLDWMSYGRRPSSLCGAALLISARFHGESLTTTEVCKTVLVCDETIRKRLAEFNQTKLAQLTVEQFDQIKDIETDIPGGFMDPPAFTRARAKESMLKDENQLNMLTMREAMKMELIKTKTKDDNKMETFLDDDLSQSKFVQNDDSLDDKIINTVVKKSVQVQVVVPLELKEDLSDLGENEVQEFILNQDESEQKKTLWTNMYGDWLREKEKVNQKKALLAKSEEFVPVKKRKPRTIQGMVNAPDPQTAILEHSKFGKQVNKQALEDMFQTNKKIKIEAPQPMLDQNEFLNQIQVMLKEEAEMDEVRSKRSKHNTKKIINNL